MDNRKIGHKYVEEISISKQMFGCLYLYVLLLLLVVVLFWRFKTNPMKYLLFHHHHHLHHIVIIICFSFFFRMGALFCLGFFHTIPNATMRANKIPQKKKHSFINLLMCHINRSLSFIDICKHGIIQMKSEVK